MMKNGYGNLKYDKYTWMKVGWIIIRSRRVNHIVDGTLSKYSGWVKRKDVVYSTRRDTKFDEIIIYIMLQGIIGNDANWVRNASFHIL